MSLKTLVTTVLFFANFVVFAAEESSFVIDKLKRIDLKAKVDLFDIELFEGLTFGGKVRYEVEPSYLGNYYSRVDRLSVEANVRPTDLIDFNEHIGLSLRRNSEITIVRQFPTYSEAVIAVPKTFLLSKLPSTADRAIENLELGEFVSLNTELVFGISASVAADQGWIVSTLYSHYVLKGEFELRIYRLKGNKIRMQVFAGRGQGTGAGFDLSIGKKYEIFGVSLIDKQIRRLVRMELLDIGVNLGEQDLFLVDYILQLDDPEVGVAYNELVQSATKVQNPDNWRMVNPWEKSEKLTEILSSTIAKFEDLYQKDLANDTPKPQRKVHRLFRGKNYSKNSGNKTRIGLNLLRYEKGAIFSDTHISMEQPDGSKNYYGFPSYTVFNTFRSFFGLLGKENQALSLNMLFLENEDFDPVQFLNMGAYFNLTDKVFRSDEQESIRKSMEKNLPTEVFNSIDWGEWLPPKKVKNGRVYSEYYFHREGLGHLSSYSQEELELRLRLFIDSLSSYPNSIENFKSIKRKFCASPSMKEALRGIFRAEEFTGDICYIAYHLHQAVTTKAGPKDRLKKFLKLKDSDLFLEIGVGFLMSLLPPEDLHQLVRFRTKWQGEAITELDFDYGDDRERELYDTILNVQSILNDRSYDLRILDDALN